MDLYEFIRKIFNTSMYKYCYVASYVCDRLDRKTRECVGKLYDLRCINCPYFIDNPNNVFIKKGVK